MKCSHTYDGTVLIKLFEVYWDILIIWGHEQDSVKQFIETLNAFKNYQIYCRMVKIRNVHVRLRNRQLDTHLHIKRNDTH